MAKACVRRILCFFFVPFLEATGGTKRARLERGRLDDGAGLPVVGGRTRLAPQLTSGGKRTAGPFC